jgi:transporter family protein
VQGVNADLATPIRTLVIEPVDKLSVVLIAPFAFAFLGELPTARDWIGILLVGAGVVILAVRR